MSGNKEIRKQVSIKLTHKLYEEYKNIFLIIEKK